MFLNTQKEGLKSSIRVVKERPGEQLWKSAKNVVPWRTFSVLASTGALGTWLQDWYNSQSEYNTKNYGLTPLGMTSDGKGISLRVPFDETDRIMNGLLATAIKPGEFGLEDVAAMLDYTTDQLPSLAPQVSFIHDVTTLLRGGNPKDHFRNKDAIPQAIWDTGDKKEIGVATLKYLWNKYGIKEAFKFSSDEYKRDNSLLEKAIGVPVVGSFANRFIVVGDYGKVERAAKKTKPIGQQEAKDRLDMRRDAADHLNEITAKGRTPSNDDYRSFLTEKRKEARDAGEKFDRTKVKAAYRNGMFDVLADTDTKIIYKATGKKRDVLIDDYLDRKKLKGSKREDMRRTLKRQVLLYRKLLEENKARK
jgi:hypothetical protein